MKKKVSKSFYLLLSSPKLTFALLVYSVVLIFIATLAQKVIGIEASQSLYFESFFCIADLWGLKFPLIGGATVGIIAFVNIVFSSLRFARFGFDGLAFSITHLSIALLILAGGMQYFLREQGSVVLRKGFATDMIFVQNENKLTETKTLPFTILLKEFKQENWVGSDIPKSYSSDVIFQKGENQTEVLISMNKPASFAGWTFYQTSFLPDGSSVLSVVKNPARLLPWIAVGATFFGMLAGFLIRIFNKDKLNER